MKSVDEGSEFEKATCRKLRKQRADPAQLFNLFTGSGNQHCRHKVRTAQRFAHMDKGTKSFLATNTIHNMIAGSLARTAHGRS